MGDSLQQQPPAVAEPGEDPEIVEAHARATKALADARGSNAQLREKIATLKRELDQEKGAAIDAAMNAGPLPYGAVAIISAAAAFMAHLIWWNF